VITPPRAAALERRTSKLERKVEEIETGFSETLYRMHRKLIELTISNRRMVAVAGMAPVSQDEVDAVIEEES
jgi:hypothetical protein